MHIPVLKDESIDGLNIHIGDVIVDGTLGGGGHTFEIIKRFSDKVKIIAFDLDKDAISRTQKVIGEHKHNIVFRNVGFQEIKKVLDDLNIKTVNSILLDLGISSFQLDIAGRGFSFNKDEPLLMTMKKDPKEEDLTAMEIVNTWEEKSISDIIYGFGEEKYANKIASRIVEEREKSEIKTTFDLVKIIDSACGRYYRGLKIHPATRTFQALRIATNSELVNLEKVIKDGFEKISVGGRLVIISFHSLEDRIVKRSFLSLKENGLGKVITKKPIVPNEEEIKVNPRSRSSKLRIIEKIKNNHE
jgi:16S rRNA (cytosine1402-N4)-methyltransferase